MGCYNVTNKKRKEIKKDISKSVFENIKSEYIMNTIIEYVQRFKVLNIIKYNKHLKRKLNATINEYKDLSEKYSSIEIELIPAKNKYSNFLNISNEKDKSYYHAYFNENKKEINRYKLRESDNAKKIKIKIDYQIVSLSGLFNYCHCIESIDFIKFNRKNISDMSYMFDGCTSLKKISFTNFKTDNVTHMNWMFSRCSSLKEINLSIFNTEKVKNMSGMFADCTSLKKIDVFYFNTINVEDISYMFSGCTSLKELNLNNFITTKVTNMNRMFTKCSKEFKDGIKARYINIKDDAFI